MALLSASFSGAMTFIYVAAAAIALIAVGLFVHWIDQRVHRMRGMADPSSPMDSAETGKAGYDMKSATAAKPSRAAFGISAPAPAAPAPPSPARTVQATRTPLDAASPGADTRTTEQSPYQIPNPPGSPRKPPPVAGASTRPPHQPLAQLPSHRPSSRLSMSLFPLREAEA